MHAARSGGAETLCDASHPEAELMAITPPTFPSPLEYQACYCEENVYKLLDTLTAQLQPHASAVWELHAIFISNATKSVLLYQQRRSSHADLDYPVVWDYHVVASATFRFGESAKTWIYDVDSRLSQLDDLVVPVGIEVYNQRTFAPSTPETLEARFRVVRANEFLQHFASDRSHMRDANGNYFVTPPPWSPIVGKAAQANGITNNLMHQYVDMSNQDHAARYGEVWTIHEWLSSKSVPQAKSYSQDDP